MPSRRTARAALAATLATAVLWMTAACGTGSTNDAASGDGATLTVLAAASLTDAFRDAGAAYEKGHPEIEIRFSFAGSQALAAQVRQGVPGDVLATADTETMESAGAGTREPAVFATNRLTVVTAPGNPHAIEGLQDLAGPGIKVVLAAEEVPAGGYSREVLDARGVDVRPVSLEADVRAVLSKVALGEADAGIVYETDARSAGGRVATVRIPPAHNAVASYPAAVLKTSEHPEEAAAFTRWLRSEDGSSHLREAGFRTP